MTNQFVHPYNWQSRFARIREIISRRFAQFQNFYFTNSIAEIIRDARVALPRQNKSFNRKSNPDT